MNLLPVTNKLKSFWSKESNRRTVFTLAFVIALSSVNTFAAGSPWETAVEKLKETMSGPIAKGLSVVAVVVGGLMFAYGEGGSKRALAGVIFGTGMAVGAVQFLTWLGIL
jgi:type IV secretion system protein TrbC